MTLAKLQLETEYRSAQSELAATFYRWCLDEAATYDRAAGYFSSTVFIVVGAKIVEFAKRGGRMRLICSPQLSAADIEALNRGHADLDKVITERLLEELDALAAGQSEQYPLKALATLVAVGTLQIQIAVRAQGHGIFHEKLGVFEDQAGNAVSFIGSANETWKGGIQTETTKPSRYSALGRPMRLEWPSIEPISLASGTAAIPRLAWLPSRMQYVNDCVNEQPPISMT